VGDILATDKYKWSKIRPNEKSFYPIKIIDSVKACKNSDDNCLMMIWPLYDDPMAYNGLINFNGNKLIYIGEWKNGCTANDEFFDLLNKQWKIVKTVNIFTVFNDKMYLFTRK